MMAQYSNATPHLPPGWVNAEIAAQVVQQRQAEVVAHLRRAHRALMDAPSHIGNAPEALEALGQIEEALFRLGRPVEAEP